MAVFLKLRGDEHAICHACVGYEATLARGMLSSVKAGTSMLSKKLKSTLSEMESRVISC